MSILGSALGAAGSIFGGISASKAMKRVKKNLEQQAADNQNWFDRRYNEDATQRADAQRVLQLTEESIRNRNRQAAGTAAVMGGSEESVAASKAANANALADAASQIAASAADRKDKIEKTFLDRKESVNNALNDLETQKAGAIASAVQGVTKTASEMF